MTTVLNIYDFLDTIAPFKLQDKTDNAGFLVGDKTKTVKRILLCLDVTNDIVGEAKEKNCDLIISHHPLMYTKTKTIFKDEPLYGLIENDISFIAMHTNYDISENGVTDLMLTKLGLLTNGEIIESFNPDGSGFGKIASLIEPVSAKEISKRVKTAFKCTSVRYVDGGKPIEKIGVCSGGGGGFVEAALEKGCDCYICGDLRWDRMVFAKNKNLTLIDAGHFHTENIFIESLAPILEKAFPDIEVIKGENSVDLCEYV